ncbi:MAG: hypothetical protein QXZ45_01150 [Candidatus Nezhaarchaeales archaeon]
MGLKFSSSLFSLNKRRAVSEIMAAIIIFVVTLTVSSMSITFLAQRANLSSIIMLQESKKAMLECSAMVKVVDMLKTKYNEAILILYNPSDTIIYVTAVIVDDNIQRVSVVLKPMSIVELSISLPENTSFNRFYLLTVEGVLIDVRP